MQVQRDLRPQKGGSHQLTDGRFSEHSVLSQVHKLSYFLGLAFVHLRIKPDTTLGSLSKAILK